MQTEIKHTQEEKKAIIEAVVNAFVQAFNAKPIDWDSYWEKKSIANKA